jgi:hypothetical protein
VFSSVVTEPQQRLGVPAALDKIESLNPRAVIAGRRRAGNDASPKIIEETRQYIRDFDRVAGTTTTARGLYDKMLELYPDRVNPGGALWLSARRQTVNGLADGTVVVFYLNSNPASNPGEHLEHEH